MSSTNQIKELLKLSSELSAEANFKIEGLKKNIDDVLVSVPDDQKKEIEGLKIMFTRALNLSKKGRTQEVNEIIKKYKNGYKSSK